jgi:hypothetical protein
MEDDRVNIDREPAALVEFGRAAQVDDGSQTERLEKGDVARGQAVQAIGAEQRAPFGRAAVGGGVSAEVTKVVDRLESDQASRIGCKVGE